MESNVDRETVFRVAEEALVPLIGQSLASASIRLHGTKLDLASGGLSQDQVAPFLSALGKGLRLFVGSKRTEEVLDAILNGLHKPGKQGP